MENEIIRLNESGLLSKIMEAGGATMKIIVPVSSFEEAKDRITRIPEGLGQYIQCAINGKELNFVPESTPVEKFMEGGKKTEKAFTDQNINDKNEKGHVAINVKTFSGKVSAMILSCLRLSIDGRTKTEIAHRLGHKSQNNIYEPLKKLSKLKLIELGKNKKIIITNEGKNSLEEYEKKNGKIELPEKVVNQGDEKSEKEVNAQKTLNEEEKLAKVQEIKMGGNIVSPGIVARELQISQEEAARLIEESER
ncbi:hypothetical protein KKB43_02755 [Patescibacteria group bacterium]|nr:hypothetical protein [Patescibacteria group bacterium]